MDGGEQPGITPEQPLSSHDLRELKRQQKLAQRAHQSSAAQAQQKKKQLRVYAVVVVLVFAAGFGLWKWSIGGITGMVAVEVGDHPTLGNGAVSFVIFGDYQCPFTRQFWQGAFPKILEKYGDKLKITFWPVPTGKHNYDRASAEAAYCANEQGKFWEYAKLLFDRQGQATDTDLNGYATELGMDNDAFVTCYESGKYQDKIQDDFAQGKQYGVVQTPTVVIGGHVLSGNLPFDDYRTFIEFHKPGSKTVLGGTG
jgi:protein-disulfide isomerase